MPEKNQFLYLTTRGWKTGKPHEIEIWFVPMDRRYYLVSQKYDRSHWVQNLQHEPRVRFRVDGRALRGTARVIDPEAEPEISTKATALFDVKYGWSEGLLVELAAEEPIESS